MKFLHIKEVTHLKDYKLRLIFNNGVAKDVDLRAELYGQVFEPLQEIELFKQGKVNPDTRTIEWPTGADFAPEFLYEIGEDMQTKKFQAILQQGKAQIKSGQAIEHEAFWEEIEAEDKPAQ